jgi:ParB family chromosome partitioning protein
MDNIQEIFIDKIDDPQHAMRSSVRDESLYELADNIKQNGLINPITVRPINNRYEVVAGHRRFSAIKINGAIKIKAVVRDLSDEEAFAVMAAENLERKDVDVVDEAMFVMEFMERTKLDTKETAQKLRRTKKYVEDRLAIGVMPEYLQLYLKEGKIKLGAALALSQIENERIRELWVNLAVEQGTSVAQAEFQLQDYRTNRVMYDGVVTEKTETDNLPTPKMITFRCALTGDEYDIRLCKYIPIYEGALPTFNEIVSALRSDPAKTESTPGGN